MRETSMVRRALSLLSAAVVLVCTLCGAVQVRAAEVYLCTPTSFTAEYNTATETVSYEGTYTGIIQSDRTYMLTLTSASGLINLSSVAGAELDKGNGEFAYSFHLSASAAEECAKPWSVTLSCYTSSVIKSIAAQVEFTDTVKYKVVFKDSNGTVLSRQNVAAGASAVAPDSPVREGSRFVGWDTEFDKVDSDLTVTAVFADIYYTVSFIAVEGGSVEGERVFSVPYGTEISAMTFPKAVPDYGYNFSHWSIVEGTVKKDLNIIAVFEKDEALWHEVRFTSTVGGTLDGDAVFDSVLHGSDFCIISVPEPVPSAGYRFVGWNENFADTVTTDLTYTACFEFVGTLPVVLDITEAVYGGGKITVSGSSALMQPQWDVAITVKDADAILSIVTVKYADMADGDGAFKYSFALAPKYIKQGVTVSVKPVTVSVAADSAELSFNAYTVTFVDRDGTVLSTQTVTEGASAVVPSAPAHDGCAFIGWDIGFDSVSSDLTVTARYETVNVDITFVVEGAGGKIVGEASFSVAVGTRFSDIEVSTVSTDRGYIFGGFSVPDGTVETSTEIKGSFYLIGDVDFDNAADNLDAARILKYEAKLTTFDAAQLLVGDVNGDGKVNSLDAALILKYDVGLVESL